MRNPFFEVTPEYVQRLTPEQLRDLIGKLCESELALMGQPPQKVRYGGNLAAKDGGLDIVVDLDTPPIITSFIPRRLSGFQAKATPMSNSLIGKEMVPLLDRGKLFPRLEVNAGAYIIVSSKDNCSDQMLNDRRQKIRTLLENYGVTQEVFVDFYDVNLITRWVMRFPSVILYFHELIGLSFSNWRPFGSWTSMTPATKNVFVLDESKRVMCGYQEDRKTLVDGINFIRSKMVLPGSSVRLIGLSGVGKTRMAEALFDEMIGVSPLNKNLVCYAKNFSDAHPSPLMFAERMKLVDQKGYLIVDDCSSANHRTLSDLLRESKVSLLTIDHDVKEDIPEQTDVVLLEPSSETHLLTLLSIRFSMIDNQTREQIARVCEGNSRMAFVLADAYLNTNSIGPLADEQLFDRIFWQRDQKYMDSVLLKTAETCALFYSFIGSVRAKNNHLKKLAYFLDLTINDVVGALADLEERQVLQTRGYWKALLPQALANRIASKSLRKIDPNLIVEFFCQRDNLDLFSSFCKRILYLHDSEEASFIASQLLNCSEIWEPFDANREIEMYQAAAWLSVTNKPAGFSFFTRLSQEYLHSQVSSEFGSALPGLILGVRHLAYFEDYFESSLLLIEKVLREDPGVEEKNMEKVKEIAYLFSPIYSMTNASIEDRLKHIQFLLDSDNLFDMNTGLYFLSTALDLTIDIRLPLNLGNITHPEGNNPNTTDEWVNWFRRFLSFAISLAENKSNLSVRVKEIILKSSEAILRYHLADNLFVDWLLETSDWETRLKAWRQIRSILRHGSNTSKNGLSSEFVLLERKLKPRGILEESFIFLSTDYSRSYTVLDEYLDREIETSESIKEFDKKLFELGAKFPQDQTSLSKISEVLFDRGNYHTAPFLSGLVSVCSDPLKLWSTFVEIHEKLDENNKNISFFSCLFDCIYSSYPEGIDLIEDFMRGNPEFKPLLLHTFFKNKIDNTNIDCFLTLLSSGELPEKYYWRFHSIKLGSELSYLNFSRVLKVLSRTGDGNRTAINILAGQLIGKGAECNSVVLLKTAQDLLYKLDNFFDLTHEYYLLDHNVAAILKVLVQNPYPGKSIEPLIERLLPKSTRSLVRIRDYQDSIDVLANAYPAHILNAIYKRIGPIDINHNMDLFNNPEQIGSYVRCIDRDFLLNWCAEDPPSRSNFVASYVYLGTKNGDFQEWSSFGKEFLIRFHQYTGVLEAVWFRIHPRSWSGDRSLVLEKQISMFESVKGWGSPGLSNWADSRLSHLRKWIEIEKSQENEERLLRNSFL